MTYDYVALEPPSLINIGYGEFYSNSNNQLYLYPEISNGVKPTGIEVYRKSASEPNYKTIKVKYADGEKSFSPGITLLDNTVKPGNVYTYRVRTTRTYDGKKYYSPYSNTVKIPVVNMHGQYTVQAVTEEGETNAFDILITSDKYNGQTIFKNSLKMIYESENTAYDPAETEQCVAVNLTDYSTDGETWLPIPSKGLTLKAGQSILLRFAFTDSDEGWFAGSNGKSTLYSDEDSVGIEYQSSGNGWTSFSLDFVEGVGEAFVDFD